VDFHVLGYEMEFVHLIGRFARIFVDFAESRARHRRRYTYERHDCHRSNRSEAKCLD
jgi:hypothetical protein